MLCFTHNVSQLHYVSQPLFTYKHWESDEHFGIPDIQEPVLYLYLCMYICMIHRNLLSTFIYTFKFIPEPVIYDYT